MERGVSHVSPSEHEHRLDHLPPLRYAPILEHLRYMTLESFKDEFGIETPVNNDGTVNHTALIASVRALVKHKYQWRAPFFDEHHLYWPGAQYDLPTRKIESTLHTNSLLIRDAIGTTDFYLDDELLDDYENSVVYKDLLAYAELETPSLSTEAYATIAKEFREASFNKLWVPREFHDFIHMVTKPPLVPELDVMKRGVKEARRRQYLFQIATNAITIREKLDRSIEMPLPSGGTLLVDTQYKRAYQDPAEMERRRSHFIWQILKHHREGLIDLTTLLPLEVVDSQSVEQALIAMAPKFLGSNIVKTRASRRAIKVELPIEPKPPAERELLTA